MITLFIILTLLAIIALIVLALGGLLVVFWPIVLFLVVGLVIDITVIKLLCRKKKK